MGNIDSHISNTRRLRAKSTSQILTEACFVLFLTSVIAWPTFSLSTPEDLSGGGNVLRQASYVVLSIGLIYTIGASNSLNGLTYVPIPLNLIIGWCWVSLFWAINPDVAVRRVLLTTLLFYFAFLSVYGLGTRRVVKLLSRVLTITLLLNYAFVILLPEQGVHQLDLDGDQGLVGAWKGFFPEKNLAGAICAVTVLLASFDEEARSRILRWTTVAMAVFFLFKTGSKTSQTWCAIAIIIGISYRFYREIYWPIAVTTLVVILGINAVYVFTYLEELLLPLQRPDTLTGRSQIWPALAAYVADHWMLGAGYGSFWNVGEDSPIYRYAKAGSWTQKVSSGHNGYLDLATQIGVPGLALAIYSFVLRPILSLATRPIVGSAGCVTIALLCFCVGHNGTESTILDRDQFINVCLTLTVAMIAFGPGRGGACSPTRQ